MSESYPKNRKSCPHCHKWIDSGNPAVSCTTCTRSMCNDCISDDPEIGPVCGLCYDRKHHPESDDEIPF
jgi:hypothetical protein